MITIHEFIKRERPICAEICEIVNEQLEKRPNMSLKEFAEYLDEVNKEEAYKRIQETERRQFGMEEIAK